MRSFFIKYKAVIALLLIFIGLTSVYYQMVELSVSKYNGYTIVVDAGHGGLDVK